MKYRILFFYFCLITLSGCSLSMKKRSFVVGQIKNASQLGSVEVTVTKIIAAKKERKIMFFIPLKDASFIAQTEAVITAGIDLNELEPGDIKIKDERIELVLPAIKVLNFSYPAERFKVLTKTNFFIKEISIADIDDFYRQAELDIRKSINHLGIEEAGREKTRNLLTILLKKFGYEEIYIQFKESKDKLFIEIPALNGQKNKESADG